MSGYFMGKPLFSDMDKLKGFLRDKDRSTDPSIVAQSGSTMEGFEYYGSVVREGETIYRYTQVYLNGKLVCYYADPRWKDVYTTEANALQSQRDTQLKGFLRTKYWQFILVLLMCVAALVLGFLKISGAI